jgi:hypothetical protein
MNGFRHAREATCYGHDYCQDLALSREDRVEENADSYSHAVIAIAVLRAYPGWSLNDDGTFEKSEPDGKLLDKWEGPVGVLSPQRVSTY